MKAERQLHEFPPVCDEKSEILILGSVPSVKSRQQGFYYGHPQNRFWKLLSALYGYEIPVTIAQKKKMLHDLHIALWDVIESCEISGSSDSSIKNVKVNDISSLLASTSVKRLYANGTKAKELYDKYIYCETGIEIIKLPSTSPANAIYTLDKLKESWNVIKDK